MKVFVSHSKKNRRRAERLAMALQGLGVDVWFDEWEILVGHNLADQIYTGITSSDYMLLLLTSASVESTWVKEEMDFAKASEIESGGTKIIPVLFEDCEIPAALKTKVYADFRISFEKGLEKLAKLFVPRENLLPSRLQDTLHEIELPIRTDHLVMDTLLLGLQCIKVPPDEYQVNLGELESSVEILIEQAHFRKVEQRSYAWLMEFTSLFKDTKALKNWSDDYSTRAFNLWFKGMPLYSGGLARKLPLNSRVAFEIGRTISGYADKSKKLERLRPLCQDLGFSERFFKLLTAEDFQINRIIEALTLELRRINDYQKLRDYNRKRILVDGIWSGFNCILSIIYLVEDSDGEDGKSHFPRFFGLSAEYVLAELNDFDSCAKMMDLALEATTAQSDVLGKIGAKLLSTYNELASTARTLAPESDGGKAFSLGLQLGFTLLNTVYPVTATQIHEVETLAIQLNITDALQERIRSILDELFYEGETADHMIDLVTDIGASFQSGVSGMPLDLNQLE